MPAKPASRKPIGNKLRFEIFKRDLFSCQYCGKTPPNTILEIDHIVPVIKNGTNDVDNLITSCFECNRGKSKNELTSLPENTQSKLLKIKEKEKQYKSYQKALKEIDDRVIVECYEVDAAYHYYFDDYTLSEGFINTSLKKFIKILGLDKVLDAMNYACYKTGDSSQAIKYFCGICWGKIREVSHA